MNSCASLLKVASEAGKAGIEGQSQLRQAISLAKRYSITDWPLHFSYLKALLLRAGGEFSTIQPLAELAVDKLISRPEVSSF